MKVALFAFHDHNSVQKTLEEIYKLVNQLFLPKYDKISNIIKYFSCYPQQ